MSQVHSTYWDCQNFVCSSSEYSWPGGHTCLVVIFIDSSSHDEPLYAQCTTGERPLTKLADHVRMKEFNCTTLLLAAGKQGAERESWRCKLLKRNYQLFMFAFLLLPVSKPGWSWSVFNLKNLDIQWIVGNELWQIGDKWNFPMCYLVASGNCKSIFLIHYSGGEQEVYVHWRTVDTVIVVDCVYVPT